MLEDVNFDRTVNVFDFNLIRSAMGRTDKLEVFDINFNGRVDALDAFQVIRAVGRYCTKQVPLRPTTLTR